MVLTIEPGLEYLPGKLMVHEENILVTKDGPQLLTTRAPKELPIIKLLISELLKNYYA